MTQTAAGEAPGGERAARTLRLLLSGLLLLQGGAGLLPGTALWGLNHLAYASWPWRLLVPALGLVVLWSPLSVGLGRGLERGLGRFLLGRWWAAYVGAPLIAVGIFWLARCRLHFLGDGWLLGELLYRGMPFHGFDFLAYHLHARLFAGLGLSSEPEAFRLFAVASTLAGGLYVGVAAWGARRLAVAPGARALLFLILIVLAPVQMFMGYVECYALLAVFLLLFLVLLTDYYLRGGSTLPLGLAFGLALAVHLDALFLAPLLLGPLVRPPGRNADTPLRRLAGMLLGMALPVAVAVVVMATGGYDLAWVKYQFLTDRGGKRFLVRATADGLFGWRHWKDLANLLLLLVPVPAALLAAAPRGASVGPPERSGARARLIALLLAGSAWLVLLMVFLEMRLGIVRDWDLFAAPAILLPVASYVLWRPVLERGGGTRLLGQVAAAALALTLPWLALNADGPRSLERFRDVIADLPRFQRAYAHEEIGKYFRKEDRIPEALAEYDACTAIYPSNPRFHAARGALLYHHRSPQAALPAYQEALAQDSTYAPALEVLARIHARLADYDKALAYARRLAGRPEESSLSAALHAVLADTLDLHEEAMRAYGRAYRKNPARTDYLQGLGWMALLAGESRAAEQSFRRLLASDPRSTRAMTGLLVAIWEPLEKQAEPARAAGRADGTQGGGEAGEDPVPPGVSPERLREGLRLLEALRARGALTGEMPDWQRRMAAWLEQLTSGRGAG